MTQTESNDDSGEIDKLLAELENESLPEDSAILNKQIQKAKDENKAHDEDVGLAGTRGEKHNKPEWADKKNDDTNTYDYSEKEVEDKEW